MKFKLEYNNLTVIKENNDPKFYVGSTLLHHIKLALIKKGFDLIKKRMWKDGHLVDDTDLYLRSRNKRTIPQIMIYDRESSIRKLTDDWNQEGKVRLEIEFTNFDAETEENEKKNRIVTERLLSEV